MLNIVDYMATWDINGGPGIPQFGRIEFRLSGAPGIIKLPPMDAATFAAIVSLLSSGLPLRYDLTNAQIIAGP